MSTPGSPLEALHARPHAIALLIAAFTLLRLVLAATVPLLPQEAYYWSWSRHLDWSYFDHPPLATYSIAATTAVFGQTVFGIKLASVLWSLGWNLVWLRLVLDMYGDRRLAFWSLAALNSTLIYEMFGVAPTPDAPLVFAWSAAVWAVWKATQTGLARWWIAAGAAIGLSWLGKYSGVLLLPVVFLYLLTSPRQRRWLLAPQPWLAALLALLVFAPVLWWNAQHDWVSLAFQSSRRVGDMTGFRPRYFAMLVGTQFLLLTPYIFVIVVATLWRGGRGWFAGQQDDRSLLLWLSGAVPIAVFTLVSLRSLVKINWLGPAYFSLVILGVHHLLQQADGLRRLVRGLIGSALLLLAAGAVFLIPNLPIAGDLNTWSGWREAAARVAKVEQQVRAEGGHAFVFSPNYKISSLIRFYLPGQPRTYAQDIFGQKALQFDYFPLESNLAGQTGILVLSDQNQGELDLARLKPYFDRCDLADSVQTEALGKHTRRVDIYRCTNYRGHPPRKAAGEQPVAD
ncbi:MAG TPA: glycosyltransferase family 39 protein [Burkholderiaceae bacterium]|jgi:4-amino-4-deoxy-L-arabinose transferase-like glycosyltransferase|nr:glycosyltransferase family 39 protein [Burkholderiaceae bacterium]